MRCPACVVAWLMLTVVAIGAGVVRADAATLSRRLEAIFQPSRVEQAALARDGRHVAFALRDGGDLQVLIHDLDNFAASARLRFDAEPEAQIRYLGWITTDRLVVAVDAAAIVVVAPDGRKVASFEDAKALSAPGKIRSGRPVVRVLGPGAESDAMLLEINWVSSSSSDVTIDVLSVNLRTDERRLVVTRQLESPGGAWITDQQGRPRVLLTRGGATRRYFLRTAGAGREEWKPLDQIVEKSESEAWQVTPRNLVGERAFPLGFDGDPDTLFFASNVGRDTFGIQVLDLRMGKPTIFALEDPKADLVDPTESQPEAALVFDRERRSLAGVRWHGLAAVTRWLDPEMRTVQSLIERKFPGRDVRLLEWDDKRERYLIVVSSDHDAGRYFVFHRNGGRCVEYQRNTTLVPDEANRTEPFVFTTSGGGQLVGYLTMPQALPSASPAVKPGLVVWFHDGPLERVWSGFSQEAQALAAQGYAVAQINYRGSAGFGRKGKEVIREGLDRVPVEDALAAITALEAQGEINRGRIAAGGQGFGGYLALRALQREPTVFQCAVAINAPLDLAQFYRSERDIEAFKREAEQRFLAPSPRGLPTGETSGEGSDSGSAGPLIASVEVSDLGSPGGGGGPPIPFERRFARWFFAPAERQRIDVTADIERLTQPVFLGHDPKHPSLAIAPVRRLRDALVRRQRTVELVELPPAFARGVAEARASVFQRVGEFLNRSIAEPGLTKGAAAEGP